ncbi:MAG: hypothetical protein JW969_15355 [Spirochaetales bacterium]|nr:hypothetical protein [Spirochaetales bacterium]
MKNNHLKLKIILLVFGIVILMTSCDQFISNYIRVLNSSGENIDVHIDYNDYDSHTPTQHILAGNSYTFFIDFYDSDKYDKIRVVAWNGIATYNSYGNIAENDWITTVEYNKDFY